jgi:3-oxoacyl-[acyl-carrier protein] reductase
LQFVLILGLQSAYAATKAAIVGFTKSIAKELGPKNVRVNAISPGFIATDMSSHLSESSRAFIVAKTALRRIGSADEVAEAAVFLASDRSSFITGSVLNVDGGIEM